MTSTDEVFMQEALKEAQKAFLEDEVPIGAILVYKNQIVSRAHNQTELLKDVTAHAEILAITAACADLRFKFLKDFSLYVTLEPCVMCAGAIKWARIGRLIYAASDPKHGYTMVSKNILHKKTEVLNGVLKDEAATILKKFFLKKRQRI